MKAEDVKIVFPFDVATMEQGEALMDEVGPYVDLAKMGLEFIHNVGTPAAVALPRKYGKAIFMDVKLNDIPNTVMGAAKALTAHGVDYINVMACGGRPMMEAAMKGVDEKSKEMGVPRPKVIAVTVLTSMAIKDLVELGWAPASLLEEGVSDDEQQAFTTDLVMRWAELAAKAGVDCLLSSPLEIAAMHAKWPDIELFSPGIRMPWDKKGDQKRTAPPGMAARAGARYLVIGRPIRAPEGGKTRSEVIEIIRNDIKIALAT